MPGNTFGKLFRLTTFGESHGPAIGGVVDGCPAGLKIGLEAIQQELDRRRPGATSLGTERSESDTVEILSGILDEVSLGTPIGFFIRNKDQRSSDYDSLKNVFRPGHADHSWQMKYGIRDHRGGGRSSARETACRVVGGAIARQLLATQDIKVNAYVSQVHDIVLDVPYSGLDLDRTYDNEVRCPHAATAKAMKERIEAVRNEQDSVGGSITAVVRGVQAGLGEPVFEKLNASLGNALFSINAVKGVEFGNGFNATFLKGSENNDPFKIEGEKVKTASNRSGGIQGGISSGEDIVVRVGFKPVSTIGKAQNTVDVEGNEVVLEAKGRHDPCVLPRAVPIVEAMVCMVLADHTLMNRSARI